MIDNETQFYLDDKNGQFLEKIDIFGIGINIKYKQEDKHKTRFGGFVTLILGGILFLLFSSSIKEMIEKKNPKVLYEQKIVPNPSRFDLTKQNFSFAMTLLDATFTPIMDESIYRFEGNFLYKEKILKADGTLDKVEFRNKVIPLEPCNDKSFQVENTHDYFYALPYQKLYCVKNIEDFYLVGQFEMDEFSVMEFRVIPCMENDPKNQVKCMESTKQHDILQKSILQIYYSTQVVQVSNKHEPFRSVGQSYFWESNVDYQSNINLLYINTFVEDDEGYLLNDINTRRSLIFNQERTMMSSKEDNSFFKLSLFLEKNKEQYYNRSYLKIPNAISEVGGIYNVLFAIGCILAQPYSQMQLHRKLFNQTFQVAKKQKKNNNQNEPNEMIEMISPTRKKNITIQSQFHIQNNPQASDDKKNKNSPLQKPQQNKAKMRLNRQLSLFEQNQTKDTKKQESTNMKNYLKKQIQQMSVKTSEFISYYINCFNVFKSDVYEIVNFGTKQIYNYTDICFIVNKLLEVEKLKHIILNEEQIKLFEFIPRPKIDTDLIKNIKKQQKRQRAQSQNSNQENKLEQSGDLQPNQEFVSPVKTKKQFNLLSMQNRSLDDKAKQAQQAFNNIYKTSGDKKSKVDLKLIRMLDENLIQLFHNNIFEESVMDSMALGGLNALYLQQAHSNNDSIGNLNKFEKSVNSFHYVNGKPGKYKGINYYEENKIPSIHTESEISTEIFNGISMYPIKQKNFMRHAEFKNRTQSSDQLQTQFNNTTTQQNDNTNVNINDSYVKKIFQN